MKKYIIILGVVLLTVCVFGYFQYNKPHEDINSAASDLKIEAPELFTEFETDEATANTKYLDKIVEVSGVVREVSPDEEGQLSVTLDSGSDLFGVICQLDNLTEQKKTDFKVGEEVTLKGICTGMLMDVVLVRCVAI
jgi:hypothetical protein